MQLQGDVLEQLARLKAEGVKVRTCVTSPPYWGLRDYGAAGQIGLERTPDEYVAKMVQVFRAVRDVLSDIPAGTAVHTDEAEALAQMSNTALLGKMMNMDPTKIESLISRAV